MLEVELVSQHNHTGMTNHGHGEIEELVAAAHAAGMTNIAVTEHYPLTRAIDPTNYISMASERLGEYRDRIVAQRDCYPEMEILVGCELDWLGAQEDRTFALNEFDAFDIVLGSVHFVDGWPFDDPAQRGHWDEVGADDIWKRYFEIWCEAVTSKAPFTVMSHPDLVKKFGIYPSSSLNVQKLYSEAAQACREGGRMIEVNTSGAHYDCKEFFPTQPLLREFHRAGVPCTIGSDAHTPEHVCRGIEEGYRYLYEAGYRELSVVVPGGDVRTIPLA